MRILKENLERLCLTINRETGSPEATYRRDADGKLHSFPGNYYMDGGNGGYMLMRNCWSGSGANNVLSTGYRPKAEMYELMHAYLAGVRDIQDQRRKGK